MLAEPAMFKRLSYSSEFVSIRQLLILSTDNASFQAKNIQAGSPDLFMSMLDARSSEQAGNLYLTNQRICLPFGL